MRIAIADDEPDMLAALVHTLAGDGYAVDTFADGEEVLKALCRETYDLLLLDWNMPRLDGIELVAWAEQNLTSPPPIIMLTSRDAKEDVVRALETGAVDYIVKPEAAEVIRARVAATLRRKRAVPGRAERRFGAFEFDDASHAVRFAGETIDLRQKEYNLALLLFENLDRPLSRAYILQRVWHSSPDVETRTLDMHISRVRSKLTLRPERGFALTTIFGFGYRLDSCAADGVKETARNA